MQSAIDPPCHSYERDLQLKPDIIFTTVQSECVFAINQSCCVLLNYPNHVFICVILYGNSGDRCVFHIGTYETLTCSYLNCFRTIGNISSRINNNAKAHIMKHLSMYEYFPVCKVLSRWKFNDYKCCHQVSC